MSADPDELFSCRNYFYLGNYTMCTKEGMNARVFDASLEEERQSFLHRASIAQGNFAMVISEINAGAGAGLQGVKLLALYMQAAQKGDTDSCQQTITQLKELMSGSNDKALQCVAATMFMHEDDLTAALKAVSGHGNLEM